MVKDSDLNFLANNNGFNCEMSLFHHLLIELFYPLKNWVYSS